jgi:hypothetical protein
MQAEQGRGGGFDVMRELGWEDRYSCVDPSQRQKERLEALTALGEQGVILGDEEDGPVEEERRDDGDDVPGTGGQFRG